MNTEELKLKLETMAMVHDAIAHLKSGNVKKAVDISNKLIPLLRKQTEIGGDPKWDKMANDGIRILDKFTENP